MSEWTLEKMPERLFVMGAGPSLELLYPHREEMSSWGHWVIQRKEIVEPFLDFIKPLYSISYWPHNKNKGYGIPVKISPNNKCPYGPSSIAHFIHYFEYIGGKELFLFGYDGNNTGYWRNQTFGKRGIGTGDSQTRKIHANDTQRFNDLYGKESQQKLKMYHLGRTECKHFEYVSIDQIKEKIND